ncbi:hypothetical protein GCM10010967_45450 [Dyadobacter beijingensis]|uniref:Uncharacterized protein n=1 Tax=Dyadobacter beijingensis TaxID=365489 RepID=A0ABQ2ICQ0_9BACT|nr:hypothetical protein [Dyadobacter beijingensis]GGN05237.1 hypothetical protein GCM10010967_45450 [Dyadobacter beijingensis]
MAATALVETLKNAFRLEKKEGLIVDAIGLAPAYHGLVTDQYILGVSAPSLANLHESDQTRRIIKLLFTHLTLEERRMINCVRVFSNVKDLDDHKYNDFDDYPYEGYEGIQRKLPDLYPVY